MWSTVYTCTFLALKTVAHARYSIYLKHIVLNMAVRLGKYSGSLGVCAQKYVLCAKTFLMCAEKNISRNIYITSAQIQLYECENIYFTAQKLLGSRRNS